jgi:molybdopterin synthase sulfur carrier subunit
MSVTVRIPTPLRKLTNGQDKVSVEGDTLRAIITELESKFPGIKDRVCDDNGEIRNFVNLYVDGEDVRFEAGLDTPTSSGSEVSIVPAVAGGN